MRIAVGDDAPRIHADEPFGDLQQDVDDMLDPDDRDAARLNSQDDVDQFARLGVGQAAADLVEQQHRGIGGERAGEFEPLAVEEAERLGAPVGDRRHAAQRERLDRAGLGASRASPPPLAAATKTFSNTVMPLNGRGIWWVRTRPSRHRSAVGAPVTSSPRKRTLPPVGACAPTSTLSRVVLPAPFGPTMPTASSARERKVDAVQHHQRAEALVRPSASKQKAVRLGGRHRRLRRRAISC